MCVCVRVCLRVYICGGEFQISVVPEYSVCQKMQKTYYVYNIYSLFPFMFTSCQFAGELTNESKKFK